MGISEWREEAARKKVERAALMQEWATLAQEERARFWAALPPMYTTDAVPFSCAPVTNAWIVCGAGNDLESALTDIGQQARAAGASAVVGIQFSALPLVTSPGASQGSRAIGTKPCIYVMGTCVVTGTLLTDGGDENGAAIEDEVG